MSCSVCTTPNLAGHLFCVGCGRALRAATEEPVFFLASKPSPSPITSDSGDADLICGACAAPNPRRYLFCGSCARSLRNTHPAADPTPETESASAPDSAVEWSTHATTGISCHECTSANPKDCQFCTSCGTPLHAPETEQEVVSTSPVAAGQSIQNRIRLRLTLLSSASLLLALAVVLYAIAGRQWTVAPLTLALASAVVSVGKLNRWSLALFTSDMRAAFGGTRFSRQDTSTKTSVALSGDSVAMADDIVI